VGIAGSIVLFHFCHLETLAIVLVYEYTISYRQLTCFSTYEEEVG